MILIRWALYGKRVDNWQPAIVIIVSYSLLGLLSMLHAAEPSRVINALIVFAKDAIILITIVLLIQRGETLRYAIWAILAGAIMLGTIGTIQNLTGSFENDYWGFGQASLSSIVSGASKSYRLGGPGAGHCHLRADRYSADILREYSQDYCRQSC